MPDRIRTLHHRWRYAVVFAASLLLSVAQPLTKVTQSVNDGARRRAGRERS